MDKIVLKLKIHLYFHLIYVMSPANGKKNEYHSRVSPIVRKGGRTSESHNYPMNDPHTRIPGAVKAQALFRAPLKAFHAPAIHSRTDRAAKYIK